MSEYPVDQHELAQSLGVVMDAEVLQRALTHRSFAYEHGGLPHNERLEFLGDSVLGIVVTDALFRGHPDLPEGKLAKLRSSVVNMRALAQIAQQMGPAGLGAYIRLGHGEEVTGGRQKLSILADTVEAVLGAIYLQHGLDGAARVIHGLFDQMMYAAAHSDAGLDWKTTLQELTARRGLGVPAYRMTSTGPDHDKRFTAYACVGADSFGPCTGGSKKQAEQQAAELAWRALATEAELADPERTDPELAEPGFVVSGSVVPAELPTLTSEPFS